MKWTLRHCHVIVCAWLLAMSCQSFHYAQDYTILTKHVAVALANRSAEGSGTNKPDVDSMRARDLRKLLVKLGYERNELKKIIDKQELRNLAHDLLAEQAKEEETKRFRAKAWYYSLLAGGLGLAYLMYEPFLILLGGLKDWFRGQSYQTTLRFKLVRKSIEHRYPLATLALIIATMIDIFQPTAQLSIMLSWVIPHGSYFRRFLLPMPNFSITLNNVLGMCNGNARTASSSSSSKGLSGSAGTNNWSHNVGDYGLNVAPMILMTVSAWVKHRLEDFGASKLMADANEKNKRKEERNNMKASRMGTPGEDMYTYDRSNSTGGGMGMSDNVDDCMHIPSSATAAAAAAGTRFQADPFLSRPIAAKGPPPPNLPFADPISSSKGKAPSISSLHFAQPISFEHRESETKDSKNVENDTSNINWHQTVNDGDFWDDMDMDDNEHAVGAVDSGHLSSIHHRTS